MSSSSSVTSGSKSILVSELEENPFTRLIESEKLHVNYTNGMSESGESDLMEEDIDFATNDSPSPQPQPDISENNEWSSVDDVVVVDNFTEKRKMVMKKSSSKSVEESSSTVTNVSQIIQSSSASESVVEKEKVVCNQSVSSATSVTAVTSSTATGISEIGKLEKAEEVQVGESEIKAKRRSKKNNKTEHISVPDLKPNLDNNTDGISISKLKSLYNGSGDSELNGVKSIGTESRVFAKVCVANLRRSFGDLTNMQSETVDVIQRPSSGGGINNELKPRAASDFGNNFQLYQDSQIEDTDRERYRSMSLVDLQSTCKDVSVKILKSSFSKFDQLSKKDVAGSESTRTSESCSSEQVNEKSQLEQKICKSCGKEVFLVELMKAEKCSWHRNCFRCVECSKPLNVDSYSSHEGKLYCKPHFKKLFQPKVVFNSEEEAVKTDLIIRESQPVQQDPDVARASDQVSTGLEDIQIDVRSKFEMFENFDKNKTEVNLEPVKRSGSVLKKKLARYESTSEKVGVANDELNVELDDFEVSEEEENDVIRSEVKRKMKSPAAAMAEIMQCKQMEEVRNKWEGGMNNKQEEQSEQRKAELNKFRSRLCHGKSNHLKEMYEKALESGVPLSNEEENPEKKTNLNEIEQLRLEKAKSLREMFEKGEVKNEEMNGNEDETDKKSLVQRDSAVFESGVAKQSRSLFKELDENLMKCGVTSPKIDQGQKLKKQNLFQRVSSDVVRSGDKSDDILPVKTEDLTNKFNFFETYEKQLQDSKKGEKKTFRITPPRDLNGEKVGKELEQEVYRDPNVVRSSDNDTTKGEDLIIQKSRTTSKMLNVFRQLEEQREKDPHGPRPLKQFTPPREPARVSEPDSDLEDEEEDPGEEESEEESENKEDAFLKEVGSLARARNLRARFERWETEENARNKASTEDQQLQFAATANANANGVDDEHCESIESARNLRAKFEQIQLQQQQESVKREVKVRRFVELTNQSDGMSEECAFCEKKVYAMEKLEANSKVYHKNCFRCSVCKAIMRMDSFTFHHGALYCKNHFKQLFKIKGNYDEGFGHETQKQIFARKQAEKENQ